MSDQLQHDRVAGLLAELEQEHGPIEPETLEEVRRAWPDETGPTGREILAQG